MSDYVPERGYALGPELDIGELPWPIFWEQRPETEECLHVWERVIVRRAGLDPEPVVRCMMCHAPRCGDSNDRDPCMLHRHHRSMHVYLSGVFEAVGGILLCACGNSFNGDNFCTPSVCQWEE